MLERHRFITKQIIKFRGPWEHYFDNLHKLARCVGGSEGWRGCQYCLEQLYVLWTIHCYHWA